MTPRDPSAKLRTVDRLVAELEVDRPASVVFTNGVFDLLHRGHAEYLHRARALGDLLVVAVNSDASARRLAKGPDRPFVPEVDRALVVAALESVDRVCIFDEDTPEALIGRLRPDVLVKGADYAVSDVAGREVVERSGGRVELIPLVDGRSTTALVARIRGTPQPSNPEEDSDA